MDQVAALPEGSPSDFTIEIVEESREAVLSGYKLF